MRLSVPLPFIAAAALLWPAAPQIAQATPYAYTFQPGATTVLGGNTEAITGSFTFDATTKAEAAVAITLSGPSGPVSYAGLYTTSSIQPSNAFMITAQDQQTQNRLALTFEFPLQFSPDPLTLVFFQSPAEFSVGGGEIDNRPLATVASPTAPLPVAEPSSVGLVAVGLVTLFLASCRGIRGRRRGASERGSR